MMMHAVPFQSRAPPPPPPWFQLLPPDPPPSSSFWNTSNVHDRLHELKDTITLAKALQNELEMLSVLKDGPGSKENADGYESSEASVSGLPKLLKDGWTEILSQESLSVEAATSIIYKLRSLLEPFKVFSDDKRPWEEKSAAARLASKIDKSRRNKMWRKRKRKRLAEMRAKERENFDQADQEADEWRTREIAKDIAKRKVAEMKEIAKVKAKKERRELESELELVLIVEKLQELRSIRVQKLKRQGHFLPDEDDEFLERVRAAVEEEERQAIAAADVEAAKDAIATAEESRKLNEGDRLELPNISSENNQHEKNKTETIQEENSGVSPAVKKKGEQNQVTEQGGYSGAYNSLVNLPFEFYHYYHGSNTDMGTLIEVRRQWDANLRPGGSRIPGHWVQPPSPADEIWASYLLRPK